MAMPVSLAGMAVHYSEGDEDGLEYRCILGSEGMCALVVDWGKNGEWIGENLGLWVENFRRPMRVAWAAEICVSQGAM